jgi:hypothetical protein
VYWAAGTPFRTAGLPEELVIVEPSQAECSLFRESIRSSGSQESAMTSPPHHGSRPPGWVLRPARHRHARPSSRRQRAGRSAGHTFRLDSPYRGFRWGYRCPSGHLTTPGSWSVRGRCATAARRGTDLLADQRRARRVKAGVRILSGKRAGCGLRTGRAPSAGESTPAHAPARPGFGGLFWTHHDGLAWPHLADQLTLRSGPT